MQTGKYAMLSRLQSEALRTHLFAKVRAHV
jgi:hypothetical protein